MEGVVKVLCGLILFATLEACSTINPLPHRAPWELFGQANSPAEHHCPEGTREVYVIVDDKEFFLECLR